MQVAAVLKGVVDSRYDLFVVLELVVVDGFGDAGQLLIDDSARADVGMSNLTVAHLTVGQTNVHARGADLGHRILLEQLVDVGRVGGENGVCLFLALFAAAEAVKNHQD